MDAVRFLNIYNRMCHSTICDECDLYDKDTLRCAMNKDSIKAEAIVSRVEHWADTHPIKTRASEFLKICPQASVDDNGIPKISPCVAEEIRYNSRTCDGSCTQCRYKFWREEID